MKTLSWVYDTTTHQLRLGSLRAFPDWNSSQHVLIPIHDPDFDRAVYTLSLQVTTHSWRTVGLSVLLLAR